MGAMALTFVACSSEDEVAVNPTFDGNAVKTQFTISLPSSYTRTRMTATNVQDAGNFLGLTEMKLYPFVTTSTRTSDGEFTILGNTVFSGAPVNLAGDITEFDHAAAQDKWYDITIPVNTNAFLFYGKAKGEQGFDKGKMSATEELATSSDTPADKLSFSLVQIYEDGKFNTEGAAILTALNGLKNVEGAVSTATDAATAKWGVVTEAQNKVLYDLYQAFSTQQVAGSATSVAAMLEDLKASVETQTCGLATALATAIGEAITTVEGNDFTKTLNLPDGAAVLVAESGVFSYLETGNALNPAMQYATNKYVYPAELYYRANSPLRVSPDKQSENLTATMLWDDFVGDYYDESAKAVLPTSQSVAMFDQIQYAVANLKTFVKFAAAELEENLIVTPADATTTPATPAEYHKVTIPTDGYTLTGILVGGQRNVNWEFASVATDPEFVVYDKTPIASAIGTTETLASHTLVLQTPGATDEKVNVALEFVNNGDDFCGIDGKLIPKGTKFYMIGQLDLAAAKAATVNSGKDARNYIFEQDFRTIAKFTISSLKNAYNVVPDLRTPKLEFGMSVNLEWQDGLEFVVEIQ